MLPTLAQPSIDPASGLMAECPERTSTVLVACPDARPPAYQAVVGLERANLLGAFHTATYYRGDEGLATLGRSLAPGVFLQIERRLRRRHSPEIPSSVVRSAAWVDAALAIENRLGSPAARRSMAIWRTRRFDRRLSRSVVRNRPDALLTFSDVGSEFTIPCCRRHGVMTLLSVVTGDPREERLVLEREQERSPDWFRIYLGDGEIDRTLLDWLHQRRVREIELANRVLVPSRHLASNLSRYGMPDEKIAVIPYAASTHRFRPDPAKHHGQSCTFLFAGGITQRKGIKYLLEAWRRVRRPGWTLQLLGALPRQLGPLTAYLDEVEWLGRVGHADVPARMAAADVFVFPSLFEGSAVVTYEALACGLPSVVTPEAGSVVRDGVEGFLVASGDVETLAIRMEQLGADPELRATIERLCSMPRRGVRLESLPHGLGGRGPRNVPRHCSSQYHLMIGLFLRLPE